MTATDSVDKVAILAANPLFAGIAADDLEPLARDARIRSLAANQPIFSKGDPGDSMMAVLDGRVRICCYSEEGKELTLNIISAGEFFGEIALIDGEPRTADAVTMEPCRLLVVDRRSFRPWVEDRPAVGMALLTILCHRLRRTSAQLEDTLFFEAPYRLARCLLRLAETFGEPVGDGTRIDVKLSQQRLGTLVGLTRESVNKCLKEWERDEIVAVESGRIVIRDTVSLEAMAGLDDERWDDD